MTINIEGAKTSEDEGSLASIRERLKQQRVFSGHPADLAGPIGGDEEEEPEGRHVQPPAGEEPPGGAPEEKKDGEEGVPEGWDFKPKYKDHREAEIGTREAERKMHEATTRAAELEREVEELKKKPPEPPATPAEPPAPAPTAEEIEKQVGEVLNEIDNLDPYADDYQAQRAKLWAKVATLRETPTIDEAKITEIVKRTVGQHQGQGEDEAQSRSIQQATRMAQEAGLDMSDKSHDSFLFWDALSRAPKPEDNATLQEQVDFMISEVKTKRAKEKSATAPETEILGRGGTPPPAKTEDYKPRTLGSIRDKWRERRTI